MDIRIEPVRPGQEDAFVDLYCKAFERKEADMIMPMMYPMGLSHPAVRERQRSSLVASTSGDPSTECSLAKEVSSCEMVAICWWKVNAVPPKSKSEVAANVEKAKATSASLPDVPGMNKALYHAYLEVSSASQYEVTGGDPFVELRMLAVHPEYQGRGIASRLMEDGLKKADHLGFPVFVVASIQGKSLYERLGFTVVHELPLDCRQYGGFSRGLHWSMVRPARKLK